MFQSTLNTTAIRNEIKEGMSRWARGMNITIDNTVFLLKTSLEDMAAG